MKRTKHNQLKILAIDPASKLGWAISSKLYGEWDLITRKDESMGMKLIRLRSKLQEIYNNHPFDLIVYERPAGMHKNPIIHQSKLIGTIETWCEENIPAIEYRGYSATEIKKFATGKGNAGKPAMIQAAIKNYGYIGDSDNEADALHLLHLAKKEYKI
ncbi:MAG: hypothetical protein ACLFVR_14730, partial [Thiohalospira sp.]